MLREVIVKLGLERIDIQEGVAVEALLNSGVTKLVMSSEFARKQGFKLKKIKRSIYMRNMNGSFNKKRPIEYMVEVNIYHQEYKKRMKINIIKGQKQSVILGMPWLACYNPEIDQRIGEMKMKWDWMEQQEKAFRKLKKRFTKEPVLAALDLD